MARIFTNSSQPFPSVLIRQIRVSLVVASVALSLSWFAHAAAGPAKPTLLFIIADHWRAQAFGFAHDPNVKTPNLDCSQRGLQRNLEIRGQLLRRSPGVADAEGGAQNNHDANFLTFHRWKNFRRLTTADSVPMPELQPKEQGRYW